mgnify:FL=1
MESQQLHQNPHSLQIALHLYIAPLVEQSIFKSLPFCYWYNGACKPVRDPQKLRCKYLHWYYSFLCELKFIILRLLPQHYILNIIRNDIIQIFPISMSIGDKNVIK